MGRVPAYDAAGGLPWNGGGVMHTRLISLIRALLTLGVLFLISARAEVVPIVATVELSGAGAAVGTNMKRGLEMAVEEINGAGGILGRSIDLTVFDTQTNAGTARALAHKAVDL